MIREVSHVCVMPKGTADLLSPASDSKFICAVAATFANPFLC